MVAIIVESIVGYCITLLLSTLYGYYRGLKRITAIPLTLATLAAAVGFLRLQDSMLGLGLIGVAVFLAIGARICQARDQHQALYRLLSRQPPP